MNFSNKSSAQQFCQKATESKSFRGFSVHILSKCGSISMLKITITNDHISVLADILALLTDIFLFYQQDKITCTITINLLCYNNNQNM